MIKSVRKYRQTVFIAIAIVLGIFMLINPAQADDEKTISQLSAEWWQWVQSIPADTNPLNPEVDADCDQNQRGPVWFLAGNQGGAEERECTVPKGKSIFFPLLNVMYFNDPGEDTSVEDKRFVVDALFSETEPALFNSRACELSCTLDGEPTVYKYPIVRSQSPPFRIKFIEDSYFGSYLAGWVDKEIVSDGFWVMLPPLSKGKHVLHFTGLICDIDTGDAVLLPELVDVTYILYVK